MKMRQFYGQLDELRIVERIAHEEMLTSGEIRVFVSSQEVDDPLEHAKGHFLKLGMDKTRERNAILIYFAPRSNRFAIVGDTAIHAHCGEAFWESLSASMHELLRQEQFTEAVIFAVKQCGALLAKHFPRRHGDTDELPNRIERD